MRLLKNKGNIVSIYVLLIYALKELKAFGKMAGVKKLGKSPQFLWVSSSDRPKECEIHGDIRSNPGYC
jgi:hypothetical protein